MMTANTKAFAVSLSFLAEGLADILPAGDMEITGLSSDTRTIAKGDLFIAYETSSYSNIQYINEAVRAGACAILADSRSLPENYLCPVPVILIPELFKFVGIIGSRFYGHPSRQVNITGITGTNGKTSVSHILARAMSDCNGIHTGLIGTIGTGLYPDLQPGVNTTPDALSLQGLFANMYSRGVKHIALEVSSHGIDQYRISGTRFKVAVFTNLSRDHLDYHRTMENYAKSKEQLFTEFDVEKAVINLDDDAGVRIIGKIGDDIPVTGYTLDDQKHHLYIESGDCVFGRITRQSLQGMSILVETPWGGGEIHTSLFGEYNASNILAACAVLGLHGFDFHKITETLSGTYGIPGRMESFGNRNTCRIIIDYAHTPAALEKVLKTLRPLCNARLICVFGCGGNRDRGKRPDMAKIAEQYADLVTLTNDNPRNEDPEQIIDEIRSGFTYGNRVSVIPDREQAIRDAISAANRDDVILVAGKGHEEYQEISGIRIPFSDRNIVISSLEGSI